MNGDGYGRDPWQSVLARRDYASLRAPKSPWDVDGDTRPAPAAAAAPDDGVDTVRRSGGGGVYGSSGDSMLDFIRNQAFADVGARTRGLRSTAMRASPDDPSLAALGSLLGQLEGQGDAARTINAGAFDRANTVDARKWQEYVMRLQRKWQEEDARRAANAALYGSLGQIGGAAISAAF